MYCARPGADLAEVVRERRLQPVERVVALDPDGAEMADVERDGIGAASQVLGDRAGRVRERHVPPAEVDQLGAEGAVVGVERRVAQLGHDPGQRGRVLHAEPLDEGGVVTPVQDLHPHVGVAGLEQPHLAVLAGDELLAQRRELEVHVERRKVEVRRERFERPALLVCREHERARLVVPLDAVEVEELGETPLGVMSEPGSPERVQSRQPPVPNAS